MGSVSWAWTRGVHCCAREIEIPIWCGSPPRVLWVPQQQLQLRTVTRHFMPPSATGMQGVSPAIYICICTSAPLAQLPCSQMIVSLIRMSQRCLPLLCLPVASLVQALRSASGPEHGTLRVQVSRPQSHACISTPGPCKFPRLRLFLVVLSLVVHRTTGAAALKPLAQLAHCGSECGLLLLQLCTENTRPAQSFIGLSDW